MLIGKRISGRYKIIKMIGDGGMANVYLAHDMILDRDVAVKILRLSSVNEDEFIRRFQREAQAATSLAHPNIVSIYDVGEEEDHLYYIVMEYVDGMTLKQYIQQRSPIPVATVLDIMQQLTSAVSHAHENHIIHRDIKPQNILIDHDGHVKITDFGIAVALSATAITQTNTVLGSVHYLSPEQARGGMATRKSDLYSLGIVMFELLTGRLPFSGESAVSIALKHLQSDTPPPRQWNPEIPQSVENIVLKATAKDPLHRYEDAEEMEEDLRTALDPERINEPKFMIPADDDATKIMPAILDERPFPAAEAVQAEERPAKESKPEGKKKGEKKKRKKWPILIGSIFGVFLLAFVFLFFILPILNQTNDVAIPDVRDEELEDAIAKLTEAGLVVRDTIEATDDEIEEGRVIKTSPKADREVKKGSEVDLYVSTGKEKFSFGNYKGKQFSDIEKMLTEAGFDSPGKKEEHATEPAGTILDQDIEPGTEVVPEETAVNFTVSLGEEKIKLKDLRGYNAKALESYEEDTGFNIDMSTEEYNDTVPAGQVISQSHEPLTPLSKGQTVKVIMSKGKKETPPQTVTKEITIPYEPAEEGMPQEVKIFIEDATHSMTTPAESFPITETVKHVLTFTVEKGKKAGYKVIRDNTVYEEEEIHYTGE